MGDQERSGRPEHDQAPCEERAAASLRVTQLAHVHVKIEDSVRLETQIGTLGSKQASREQAGDRQQDEAAGDLRDDEDPANSVTMAGCGWSRSTEDAVEIRP